MTDLLLGDVQTVLPTLPAESFDAMLSDPPYGLGFMGQDWDSSVPPVEVWREVMRVLKPGAFALVFGGTRTWHRLAVALEDAGFEIRDTIMWIYASGYPKSKNLDGEWTGYGSALKPAWEPILLVRKPTRLSFAANAELHGTGALNIDACRVPTGEAWDTNGQRTRNTRTLLSGAMNNSGRSGSHDLGRWPANLIHDGSDEIVAGFPSVASGRAPTGGLKRNRPTSDAGIYGGGKGLWKDAQPAGSLYGDSGSAARFFYVAKPTREERDGGLAHLAPQRAGVQNGSGRRYSSGDPYLVTEYRNPHPTLKPMELTRYLATLLLPPVGRERRVLVPFAGTGSEIIGALQAGWDCVTGVEINPEYRDIAQARIEHHLGPLRLAMGAAQ